MSKKTPWIRLNYTDCNHLAEVIDQFFRNAPDQDLNRIDEWLLAIRPESGWRQETSFDPHLPQIRNHINYGEAFFKLHLIDRRVPMEERYQ